MTKTEIDVLTFKLSNVTTERDVANQEIERLKEANEHWCKQKEQLTAANAEIERLKATSSSKSANIISLTNQLTTAKEKLANHRKHVSQFLNDLYCTMIDPLVEGEMQVAPMMIALVDQAQKDRESLSQLTAAKRG